MNSSQDFQTTSIFGEHVFETITTDVANFSSNDADFYNYYDLNVLNTTNASANGSDYYHHYYGCDINEEYYEYYIPTPAATAIVLVSFGLILFVGIVGNILVIIIIAAVKSMHTTVHKCLFSLAVADLGILSMLPMIPIQQDFTDFKWDLGKELCLFLNFYDRGAVSCSVLTFYYVSIDRYFALCYPMKSRALWTGRKTYVILVAIWVVSLALSYPYLQISTYREENYNNASEYICYFDEIDKNWMKWYDTSFGVFTILLPIPVLMALYGRMIYRIRRSVPKHNSGTTGNDVAGRRGRTQVVVLLLTVVVMYIVSQLPFTLLQFFSDHCPAVFNFWLYDENTFTTVWISRILYYVNSAANPVIYFSMSTNFRQGFLQIFCCFGKKKFHNQ